MASFALTFNKRDEDSGLSSYYNNKTTVIQEARVFNESPISPRKCRALLTRIVYLLYVGETFGTQEATTLFFGTTKLFQHKDVCDQTSNPTLTGFVNDELTACIATSSLSRDQGAGDDSRRCYHGHCKYNEGYPAQFRGHLSSKCYKSTLSHHRRASGNLTSSVSRSKGPF